MNQDIHKEITANLNRDYKFKLSDDGKWLQQGACPSCKKNELFTNSETPWVLRCGRENKCGDEFHVKDLYPDVFENLSKRHPVTTENPNATADAYLETRQLNKAKLQPSYRQESFYSRDVNVGTPTVRFYLDADKTIYWERFIENVAKIGRKAHFGGSYNGLWWMPPRMTIEDGDTVYLDEGIFDSAAHWENGYKSTALLTCYNYPEKALAKYKDKRVTWVWALDGDNAGRKNTLKFVKRMREEIEKENLPWKVEAAQIPQHPNSKTDWNDLHKQNRLNDETLKECRYKGALLIAQRSSEKALLIYNHDNKRQFPFEYKNRLYWFQLDVDKFHKELERLEDENTELTEDERRERALTDCGSLAIIANCYPQFLYFQANKITDESWYYLRVNFPHKGKAVKNTFTGGQLSSSSEFKKRLLAVAPGAMFTGTSQQLDAILEQRVFNIKTVETVDYIGYSREHRSYIYRDVAMRQGKLYHLNDEDYFDLEKLAVKSLSRSTDLAINTNDKDYTNDWVDMVWRCWGAQGLAAVAYWMGTLFAEQIRERHESYPFLELIGEPGAGKSTLFEFLWRLFGRDDYEGVDPSNSTLAAISRTLSQVSNLPVVFLEGDRDSENSKNIDWNQFKTLYNGRSPRARGVKNGGNDTYEPPFRGALVITQNATVDAAEAILQRIVHIKFTREGHNEDTRLLAESLARLETEQVSGFLVKTLLKEMPILQTFEEACKHYEGTLMKLPEIKTVRIGKNHGQLMALVDCLSHVIPVSPEQRTATKKFITQMAIDRQQVIGGDHPKVQEFWEVYEFLNGDEDNQQMNHSRNGQIAINMNHFYETARDRKQDLPLMKDMKRLLKDGRRYKFEGIDPVNSAIFTSKSNPNAGRTVKCWIFKDTQKPQGATA
ncbi:toprim domain-containing protein [Maricurvus nonylphenolicus]|uniref:toprim domain-containing protein n=1 Tax=Maricurvus nonylphenolicus TaxID=1008307 RepID=UPI0036F41B89